MWALRRHDPRISTHIAQYAYRINMRRWRSLLAVSRLSGLAGRHGADYAGAAPVAGRHFSAASASAEPLRSVHVRSAPERIYWPDSGSIPEELRCSQSHEQGVSMPLLTSLQHGAKLANDSTPAPIMPADAGSSAALPAAAAPADAEAVADAAQAAPAAATEPVDAGALAAPAIQESPAAVAHLDLEQETSVNLLTINSPDDDDVTVMIDAVQGCEDHMRVRRACFLLFSHGNGTDIRTPACTLNVCHVCCPCAPACMAALAALLLYRHLRRCTQSSCRVVAHSSRAWLANSDAGVHHARRLTDAAPSLRHLCTPPLVPLSSCQSPLIYARLRSVGPASSPALPAAPL